MDKKSDSSKKKNLKKAGILNRPINPEFLRNAVHKTDGIEIKTNHPLLPLNQNNSTNRKVLEKEYQCDKEEGSLNNFLDLRKKQQNERLSPQKIMVHVSSDTEFVKKSIRNSPNIIKSPMKNEESSRKFNNKEYIDVMEKMNQISSVKINLF